MRFVRFQTLLLKVTDRWVESIQQSVAMRESGQPNEAGVVPTDEEMEAGKMKDADLERQQETRKEEPATPAHTLAVNDVEMTDAETETWPRSEG